MAFVLAGLAAVLGATAAQADNDHYQLTARSCSPYIIGGCEVLTSLTPLPLGLNVGGGYAFASGYHGGYAFASAVFAPGAATLLQSGRYQNGSIADYTYTFQVRGQPDTLVPLHMSGLASTSAIHLTDEDGQVVNLVDGITDPAPTNDFTIVASAFLQISPVRLTPYPVNGGAISLESSYQANGYAFCQNCDGGSSSLDQTTWVWSNSDITVHLDASTLVQYDAVGEGHDPMSTFGDVSAEIDPTFAIDDPAYSAFSIVGVPTGVPPPVDGAVPEPATWALMFSGFGVIGFAMRSRRRVRTAVTIN